MVVIKYYCDCCGREVDGEDDLKVIVVYSPFLDMQDNPHPYESKSICGVCSGEIAKAICDKYNDIHNRGLENDKNRK